ncbi:hypothetical protein DQ04_05511040 [Trypanosoma grayi]|uniref:hypothetical protein n=1 Tax=Trypanosoma grayi TaxID=71804 RepID=UPI0004F45DBA|nr:hypothetical protein DQ04_05511040 [Trypanosoma grayi]KEG09269.1 hypothetical protein DQ04_05511040 [Trypanosoma grayi]
MDGQVNSQPHGSTRHTPPSQQNTAALSSAGTADSVSEGLDVFDLQLRKDCANVPGSFMGGFNVNATGPSPSPTVAFSAAMFSSVATASQGLASTMSNPQTTRCMVRDVARLILSYISAHVEPQPEKLSDEYERQLILQFVEELQRTSAPPPAGVMGSGDGRWTIDKEVVLSLKNSRGDGLPPPGAEVARPHHPYAVCGAAGSSPRLMTQQQQQLWRGTPPIIAGGGGMYGGVATVNGNSGGSNNNSSTNIPAAAGVGVGASNGIARSCFAPIENLSPAGVGTSAAQYVGLSATSLSKRVGGGDVIRPQPHHPRSGGRGVVSHRHAIPGTKKVLRSASSAFSECSAGDTGEVSSSMSRTTVGRSTGIK